MEGTNVIGGHLKASKVYHVSACSDYQLFSILMHALGWYRDHYNISFHLYLYSMASKFLCVYTTEFVKHS